MVLRLAIHKICIFCGLCICFLSAMSYISNNIQRITVDSPLNAANTPPLIIDAGHGGMDGGAVGLDGTVESNINLQIAEKLNLLGKLCGIQTIMTRSSDNIEYPPEAETIAEKKIADQKARLRLIQAYPHAILYSIHQNTYPNESVKGIHVLYGHNENSQILGVLLQKQFNEILPNATGRTAIEISNDIYLMKHCPCTAVLIECGFISNFEECQLVQNSNYQKLLSVSMLSGYFQFLNH